MSESQSAADRMKQHFSHRVIHQVRQIIDLWRQLPQRNWQKDALTELSLSVDKLIRYAGRFGASRHQQLGKDLLQLLTNIAPGECANNTQLQTINRIIQNLSQTALRHTDSPDATALIPQKKPIYIALQNTDQAVVLAEQMQYFSFRPELQRTPQDLVSSLQQRHPAAIVLDHNFGREGMGLEIAAQIQQQRETPLPVIFTWAGTPPCLKEQIQAQRSGSIAFMNETNVHALISKLETRLDCTPPQPQKVLVVDDSRTQSVHAQNILNKAGMITRVVNEPLQLLEVLQDFVPDIVLMDMYMPDCNGMELARIIRQQPEYFHLPIIYVSGEEDRDRQLAAMAEGGDDFLTKPVSPAHLVTTIRNRVDRARQLQQLIARDSLTGLLNHTHLQEALQQAISAAEGQTPVSFAMIDIDHFKQVNDQYGHPVGDSVIRNLSLFLRQSLRKSDPIGRYGGEEFAVVLVDANLEQAAAVMDKIRKNFSCLTHDQQDLNITFSCGVSEWQGQSVSELIAEADKALYRAKDSGRNQVCTVSSHK